MRPEHSSDSPALSQPATAEKPAAAAADAAGDGLFVDVWHRRFLTLLCLAEVSLILVTWPLWLGASKVRWISVLPAPLADWPRWVDLVLTITLMAACGRATSERPSSQRASNAIVVAAAVLLSLLNVARLQPWHWLFLLLMSQVLLFRGAPLRRLNQLTLASVYLFAAISRFDPAIPVNGGMPGTLLQTLLGMVDLQSVLRNPETARWLTVAANAWELAVGLCLLIPRWHRCGVVLAVILHAGLLTALGPWALGHSWGVLIWNLFLLCGVPVLFLPRDVPGNTEPLASVPQGDSTPQTPSLWRYRVICAVVFLIPTLALFGLADNWLGWQVYSPRTDRVWLRVTAAAVHELPRYVQPYVGNPPPLSDLHPVRIDRWVNAATGAPIYPEDRYQLGLVRYLVKDLEDGTFEVGISTPQSPAWWLRSETVVTTQRALSQAANAFWVPATRR